MTKSFPAYSVIVGSPARLVKQYDRIKWAWIISGAVAEPEVANELLEWVAEEV